MSQGGSPGSPPAVPLLAELDVLRCRLRGEDVAGAAAELARVRGEHPDPTPLDRLCAAFGLSDFERSVLLLAAGPELAGECGTELVAASGIAHLSFGLALRLVPGAHWDAVTPVAPLRRWQLVRLLDPVAPTRSGLVADERVLHELLGVRYLDPEVAALVRPVGRLGVPAPSLVDAAATLASAWEPGRPVLLTGPQPGNVAPVAGAAAHALGRTLLRLAPADLPTEAAERDRLLRLLERESVLGDAAWAFEVAAPEAVAGMLSALHGLQAPALVIAPSGTPVPPTVPHVRVPRLGADERAATLSALLRSHADREADVPDEVHAAAAVFDLPVDELSAAAAAAAHGTALWAACREQARRAFDGLARLVEPCRSWDDLVLPAAQVAQLHGLVDAVRHRGTVNEAWGFAQRGTRGLGTAALFAGASGVGKTLAAEVVAGELGLDLLVIDLSQVVSKYIGDTEKNLARVFDAAEDSGAVLLFDEADALFGKRTEVRDSHDRYANLEVGYLLQRVESFRGLAILTTNARGAIDQAFLRRLRVIVSFPYPDAAARADLWRRAFPAQTPLSEFDPAALATIDLPGGGIAAAALTAAYLGASRGVVTGDDVAAATAWELAKHGRATTAR